LIVFKRGCTNYFHFPVTKWLFLNLISTSIKYTCPVIGQYQSKIEKMGCLRVVLAIIFPPLAVIGKGCGSFIIVFLLTLCGWVPGVIAALIILNNPN